MKKIRESLILILKLGIAVAVLAYIFNKMDMSQLRVTLQSTAGHWPWLLAGFMLCLPPLLLCMVRWKMILDAQDMRLGWSRVNSIFFIGLFFNSFMIGPTGGDLVKAYYTARETNHKKTEAVSTVFIDRIIGLLVLALIVGTVILARWNFFMSNSTSRAYAWPTLTACAILLGGGVVAFSVHLFEVFPFMKRWNHIRLVGKVVDTIERVYNAFYVCRANPRLLLRLALTSLAIQLIFVGVGWCVGCAMGMPVAFIDYLSFSPMVGLISAIPLTPGGTGIREFASIQLWSALGIGSDKALLLAFIPYIFMLLWGLPGGLLFLLQRSRIPPATPPA
ncbi:MAG: lysylphosphatidylglycerol synthase transmembrane domain-containing protein [bacterium]